MDKVGGGNDTPAEGMEEGGDVAVENLSENATSSSTSARVKPPAKGNKNSTNHTPKPTIRKSVHQIKLFGLQKNSMSN